MPSPTRPEENHMDILAAPDCWPRKPEFGGGLVARFATGRLRP